MQHFLTHETPGKVFALLGTALFSLAFMFGVTVTNASFTGQELPLPDMFGPTRVMAVLDTAANSYSNFVATNLIAPGAQEYGVAADNISWVTSNAGDSLKTIFGLNSLSQKTNTMIAKVSQQSAYAGTATAKLAQGGLSMNSLSQIFNQ